MVMSARRAYSDAVKWVKAARPRGFRRGRWAERALGASVAIAVPLLTVIALASPASFASPASNTLRTGWPLYALLGLLAVSLLYLLAHRKRIRWSLARVREPFVQAPQGDPRYEGAADALAACPGPLRVRFVVWWVWGPVAAAVVAVMCAFASAYFLVDAILARFNVGRDHPLLAGANLVLSFILFALASRRLSTWRVALAAHRSVTVGY